MDHNVSRQLKLFLKVRKVNKHTYCIDHSLFINIYIYIQSIISIKKMLESIRLDYALWNLSSDINILLHIQHIFF